MIDSSLDIMMLSSKLERALLGDRDKSSISDMPWFTLPAGYSFKVTFPFCGAAARFRVCNTNNPDKDISVYYDTQSVLGFYGALDKPVPYWEAYPIQGDTARFALHESEELIAAIVAELSKNEYSETKEKLNG